MGCLVLFSIKPVEQGLEIDPVISESDIVRNVDSYAVLNDVQVLISTNF